MRAGDGKQGIKLQWPYCDAYYLPGSGLIQRQNRLLLVDSDFHAKFLEEIR